ncbi:MAG: hypothetical protein QXD23_02555 [Candidatus Micrarchaeaceae archaeon]
MIEHSIITTKTPFRITFTGGGTDLPDFYRKNGPGATVSATINSYVYITAAKNFYDNEFRISYSATENAITNINDIKHPTVREAIRLLNIEKGLQLISITEIPSYGTGMGSSSSFLVGLLNALHAWKGELAAPKKLAEEAVYIEREVLKEHGGKQDQYAAAFGGINLIEFYSNDEVSVKKLPLSRSSRKDLESNLLLVYTGKERSSTEIHKNQSTQINQKLSNYNKMVELAYETSDAITENNWIELGNLLNENWELKKELSNEISNDTIDNYYKKAIDSGAIGGKLIGAGGSGFLLFLVPPEKRQSVINSLNLKIQNFEIETNGSGVVYVN